MIAALGEGRQNQVFDPQRAYGGVRTKPAFRDAWKRGQRCLVVTNGFYDRKKLDPKGKKKQAYAIGMVDDREMVMAGLWETWSRRRAVKKS